MKHVVVSFSLGILLHLIYHVNNWMQIIYIDCCAVCGGNIDSMYNSAEPSISSSPTEFCEDVTGWFDSLLDNCDDYGYYQWCEDYGDSFAGLYNLTANEACCGKFQNFLI